MVGGWDQGVPKQTQVTAQSYPWQSQWQGVPTVRGPREDTGDTTVLLKRFCMIGGWVQSRVPGQTHIGDSFIPGNLHGG
jgi:hypothetical protein